MVNFVFIEEKLMASTRQPHQQDEESKEQRVLYLLMAGALLLAIITVALSISDLIELIHLLASPLDRSARP
jgi:hypothetical protein